MYVSKIIALQHFSSVSTMPDSKKTSSFLDKIHERTRNSADMTDTIVVPRTIFKGYLGIMAGTTLATLGAFMTNRFKNVGKFLSVTGLLTSMYGTWAFVRPFVLKDAPGVEHSKQA